jgi:sulfur carrier protein
VSTEGATIEILLNGKSASVPKGQTVLGLLESLGIQPARVAVELNRRIVKQREWPSTQLSAGAEVEIVHFVGGG